MTLGSAHGRAAHAAISLRVTLVAACKLLAYKAVLLLAFCWPDEALAQELLYQDEEVKAAFIYHFATFVQWPEASSSDQPFTIAVLGADDVAAELQAFLPGRAIQSRPIEVRRLRSVDDIGDAAVLFIGADQSHRLPSIIRAVEDRPLLLVSDAPGALRDGAMINFQVVDRRVRFEISLTAAERAGLELSSRLLSAAMSVDTTSAVASPRRVVLASTGPAFIR